MTPITTSLGCCKTNFYKRYSIRILPFLIMFLLYSLSVLSQLSCTTTQCEEFGICYNDGTIFAAPIVENSKTHQISICQQGNWIPCTSETCTANKNDCHTLLVSAKDSYQALLGWGQNSCLTGSGYDYRPDLNKDSHVSIDELSTNGLWLIMVCRRSSWSGNYHCPHSEALFFIHWVMTMVTMGDLQATPDI